MRQETDRLQLIQKLGKHSKTMADTWLKLAVELAIAALYSEEIGDDTWIEKQLPPPLLNTRANVKSAQRQR